MKKLKIITGTLLLALLTLLFGCRSHKAETVKCYKTKISEKKKKNDSVQSPVNSTTPVCYGAPANPERK